MDCIPPKGTFLWITDLMERSFVEDAYRALQLTPGAEEWLRTAEPPADKGFMWWDHPMVAALKANLGEGHSGSSAAFTLRTAQEMAKKKRYWPSSSEHTLRHLDRSIHTPFAQIGRV
jgi:hypothetical protein